MTNCLVIRLKYLFVLMGIMLMPISSFAQAPVDIPRIDQTDQSVERLIYFWDMRMARETFAQMTNVSQGLVFVHVQIFNVTSPVVICEETDFDDVYTPGDTHVYDLGNLVSNNDADGLGFVGFSAPNADLDEGYGLVVISLESGPIDPLIGLFRIIDGDSDFEYRTNAAGEENITGIITDNNLWTLGILNFNDVDGANLSDVVGLVYRSIDPGSVVASPLIQAVFGDATGDVTDASPQVHIFDEFESPTSCSPTTFACDLTLVDKGIDNFHPNSKGEVNRICNDSVDVGWLFMPFQTFNCFDLDPVTGSCGSDVADVFFVGFLGLNNGDGTGSMDSWWSQGLSDDEGGLLP